MAISGSEVVNPRTGQRTRFLQTAADTSGSFLRMETFHVPHKPPEPEHVHPSQRSRFEVVTGTVCFQIRGEKRIYRAGEVVNIPANTPHFFWVEGDEETHAIQEFRPALSIEDFFVTYFALAREGKLNDKGLPNLLQMAVLMRRHNQDIRVTNPPRIVQQLVMWTFAPFGRLLGYREAIT